MARSLRYVAGRGACALAAAGVLVSLTPAGAAAYVDPGLGSMVGQLILGGVAGLLVLVKLFWSRIKGALQAWVKRRSAE